MFSYFAKQKEKKIFKRTCEVAGLVRKQTYKGQTYTYVPRATIHLHEDVTVIELDIPHGLLPGDVIKNFDHFKKEYGEFGYLETTLTTATMRFFHENPFAKEYPYKLIPLPKDMIFPVFVGYEFGKPHFVDLAILPHILVCGTTGSGKSVQIRNILTTIILSSLDVDLYLYDLKRSEFFLFKSSKKTVSYAVEPEDVVKGLKFLFQELKNRGAILEEKEEAHFTDVGLKPIFVCIDEMQDLSEDAEAMGYMKKIAAQGRALGIFLLLSTQRPDATVIVGPLKNNLNVTMAFKMKNSTSSRVAIDESGAENLGNPGEMILSTTSYTKELKAPYLTIPQAKELLAPHRVIKPKEKGVYDE